MATIKLSNGICVKTEHWWAKLMSTKDVQTFITLGQTIHCPGNSIERETFKHELQHTYDFKGMGLIPGALIYLFEFVVCFFKKWNFNAAYLETSFEKRAYEYEKLPLTKEEEALYQELMGKLK